MARKFSELRDRMEPERRARNAEKSAALVAAIDLAELRGARNLTQEELAERLNISQSNVSRLEQRDDILVSTLRQVVEAMMWPNGADIDPDVLYGSEEPAWATER